LHDNDLRWLSPSTLRKLDDDNPLVAVRFDPETLDALRAAAQADDRSVSSWIRRAVEHELSQRAG
jgi:hypothetical protein